ncbi:2'-5' RNA ligase family protein [Brevibacillus daliensis]|uniref:2'-5' RNA ligase family protein n=1 Tax=Brevibacillus daliensis TaxID=2892995 RepID=UPI001E535D32|nr:2'-5' RNA ligase family protein [Brevibacillus daliensis]
MQRAIHIFPEFENMNVIEEVRQKYDPLQGIVPPHITLVFPFESEMTSAQLERQVRETLVGVSSFPIQLKGITATLDNYLFLNVKKGNDNIIDLHDRLYSGPLAGLMSRRHTYTPHVTVGKVKNETELQTALIETKSFTLSFDTIVTKVTSEIIESNGNSTIEFIVSLS